MRLAALAGLILGLSASQAPAAPAMTEAELRAASTTQLAAALLPADAPPMVSHSLVDHAWPPNSWPAAVRFRRAPSQLSEAVCGQGGFYVSMTTQPAGVAQLIERERIHDQEYLGFGDCAALKEANFAVVQPATELAAALPMMAELVKLKAQAAGTGAVDAKLTCHVESNNHTACDDGPRAILAQMPLELAYLIERPSGPHAADWRVVVASRPLSPGVGVMPWVLEIRRPASDETSVDMIWKVPNPF